MNKPLSALSHWLGQESSTLRKRLLVGALCLALPSCSSAVHLHDAGKAKAAKEAEDKYKGTEVVKVIDVENANLTALLEEELKVVRSNRQLRFDLEMLSLAADEDTRMVRSLDEAHARLRVLGFNDVGSARAYLTGGIALEAFEESMADGAARVRDAGGPALPRCPQSGVLPDLVLDPSLSGFKKGVVETEYEKYRARCAQFRSIGPAPPGELSSKRQEIAVAREKVLALRAEIKTGKGAEAAIGKERQAAMAAAESKEIAAALSKNASNADKKISAGVKALGTLGLDHPAFAKVDAIQTVLRAVADGSVMDAGNLDPALENAATVAAEIPSLAQDMIDLLAKAEAPSVSNLLIALNHQKILIAGDEASLLLAQRRVDLLEEQYDALVDELRASRDLHDQFCNYATRRAGGAHPGMACDAFRGPQGSGVTCTVANGVSLADCALAKPWREALSFSGKSAGDKAARRALYRAVAALAFAHDAKTRFIELDYRLIDLDHREAVAANRLALEAWNNLVAVPVEQIAAYHSAGVKPDEIAQLVVQALGFASITTGVLFDD